MFVVYQLSLCIVNLNAAINDILMCMSYKLIESKNWINGTSPRRRLWLTFLFKLVYINHNLAFMNGDEGLAPLFTRVLLARNSCL